MNKYLYCGCGYYCCCCYGCCDCGVSKYLYCGCCGGGGWGVKKISLSLWLRLRLLWLLWFWCKQISCPSGVLGRSVSLRIALCLGDGLGRGGLLLLWCSFLTFSWGYLLFAASHVGVQPFPVAEFPVTCITRVGGWGLILVLGFLVGCFAFGDVLLGLWEREDFGYGPFWVIVSCFGASSSSWPCCEERGGIAFFLCETCARYPVNVQRALGLENQVTSFAEDLGFGDFLGFISAIHFGEFHFYFGLILFWG